MPAVDYSDATQTSLEEDVCRRYLEARAALERGEIFPARRELEALTEDFPGFSPAWDSLGSCWDADGDLKRAGECYRRAWRVDRRNWRSRLNWGKALHRSGDLPTACRALREAARFARKERCVHHALGRCLADRGDHDAAVRAFQEALTQAEADVPDAQLYTDLARSECERGNYETADEAFQRACLLSPDDADLYYHWAVLSARAGSPEVADRLAVRSAGLERGAQRVAVRAPILRVCLALDAGDADAARTRIEELERLTGAQRLGCVLRAELARRSGTPGTARELALEALRMAGHPADQAVDRALALLRELEGRYLRCQGYRLLVEADTEDGCFFRPYVVLAPNAEEADGYVAALQDALDSLPWRIVERGAFPHRGKAQPGVYQVLLTRVIFPPEESSLWSAGAPIRGDYCRSSG